MSGLKFTHQHLDGMGNLSSAIYTALVAMSGKSDFHFYSAIVEVDEPLYCGRHAR